MYTKNLILSCLIIFTHLFFFCPFLEAQTNKDTEFWTGITIEKSLHKNLSTSLRQEVRIKDNATQFKQYLNDIALSYQPVSFFEIAPHYRFSVKPDKQIHRIYADATFSQKIPANLSISWRTRFQHEITFPSNKQESSLRPLLSLKFKPSNSRFAPYTAVETFYQLNSNTPSFNRYRIYAGSCIKLSDHHGLKLFYTYQKSINIESSAQRNLLVMRYKYTF
jgi:hypothetical protein